MMKAIRPRVAAFICCCLLPAAPSALAQSDDGTRAESRKNAAMVQSNSETEPSPESDSAAGNLLSETLAESRLANSDGAAASDQAQGNSQGSTQNQTPAANNPQAPSLQDLGLSPSQTQSDPQLQARLDRRAHMLKIHQRLGLITTIPMIATVATSFGAGGRSTSTSDRWAHMALGSVTTDLYFTTAYFAIRAPRIPGTQTRGQTRVHKALAWVHGPGMILTPILGAIAFDQRSKGERVHGIASAHGAVAIVTAGAYAAALLSVSFKF
jgi:hypothetical protein